MSGCSSGSGSVTPTPGCALRSCKSACGSPSPGKQPPAALLAAEYTSSSLQQRSSPGAAGQDEQGAVTADDTAVASRSEGGAGLRRGINFGDTQIYEYEQPARGRGGPSNNSSRRSSKAGGASRRSSGSMRSSDGGGGSSSGGGALAAIHRSKSLGSLLMSDAGHLSAPGSGVEGQVPGSGGGGLSPPGAGQLRAPQARAASRSPSSKGVSNDSISSSGVGRRSPARRSTVSVHRRDPSASALQQVGSMCVLPDAGQQQQWLAVPQLPRMAGAAQSCLAHLQRSKSSSPVCVSSSIANGSGANTVLRPGVSPVGAVVGSPSRRAL
jgi:hypothetical protein